MTKKLRNSIDKAQALLETAARLFRQKGFAATTVREIAEAAGILPGSLHYRYPTKEAILLELTDQGIDRAIASIRAAVSASKDPVERLKLAFRHHLKMLLSGDDSIYVLLYEWRTLPGKTRQALSRLRDRYEAFWDGLLYEAAGAGRVRDDIDLKLIKLFGLGAVNWAAQWYSPDGDRTPDEIADAFWTYLTNGVVAEERSSAGPASLLRKLSETVHNSMGKGELKNAKKGVKNRK